MKSDVVISTLSEKIVYFGAKLIGLAPFTLRDNKLHPATPLSKAYNIILTTLTVGSAIISFYFKIQFAQPQYSILYLIMVILNIGFSVSWFPLLGYKGEVIIDIIKRILAIENQLMKLQTTKRDGKIFKSCLVKAVAINVVIFILHTCAIFSFSQKRDHIGLHKLKAFVLMIIYFNRLNMILMFAYIVGCINRGFKCLNSELQNLFRSDCETLACHNPNNIFAVAKAGVNRLVADQTPQRETIRYSSKRIATIRHLHKELCDYLKYTTEFFTVPLFWIIGYHFSYLLLLSYTMYEYFSSEFDITMNTGSTVFTLLELLDRAIILVTQLYCLTNVCAATCEMGNKTRVILHQVWNKFQPTKLKDEFWMFSIQLLRNQVVVSVLEVFDLDFSYLYQLSCTILTYLIIMIQLDGY